jgi:hypothetical protein
MAKSKVLKGGEPLPGGQEHLPGAEPMPKNEKIHRLARRCKDASKAWSAAAGEHKGLKEMLIEAMIEAKLDHYQYGDVDVQVDTSRKLKVKIANDDEEE